MAISKTQSISSSGANPQLTGVASGALLILASSVFDGSFGTGETTPTDSAGTFSVQDTLSGNLSGAGSITSSVFYEANASSGTHTSTPHNYGAGNQWRSFTEFAGAATSTPLDVKTSAHTDNTNHTSQGTGTTGTTAQADEMVFIICTLAASPGSATVGWTDPVSGFTTLMVKSNDSTDIAGLHSFKIIAATGTQTATHNWTDTSASQTSMALIGTYKAAGASSSPTYPQLERFSHRGAFRGMLH